jgi:hypothetical protein
MRVTFDAKDGAHKGKGLKYTPFCTLVGRSGFQQNICYLYTKLHVVTSKKTVILIAHLYPRKAQILQVCTARKNVSMVF